MTRQEIRDEIARLEQAQVNTSNEELFYELELEINGLWELLAGDGT